MNKKSEQPKAPLILRTFGFGVMLIAWWVLSFELPQRMLNRLFLSSGVDRTYPKITLFIYEIIEKCVPYRAWWIAGIFLAMIIHYFVWKLYPKLDHWGRWLFKFWFFVLYFILYGYFLLVFFGVEIPIWTWPQDLSNTVTPV